MRLEVSGKVATHHRGLRALRERVAGSTSNPTWRKFLSVVITVVRLNSRMIAKLGQSVKDRSLSRYWKNRCRAHSNR